MTVHIDSTLTRAITIDGNEVLEVTQDGDIVWFYSPYSASHQWKFDEGTGSTAEDGIGGADGTINGPLWTTGSWVDGVALSGDGVDDYVSVGTLGSWGSTTGGEHAVMFTMESTDDTAEIMGVRHDANGSAGDTRWGVLTRGFGHSNDGAITYSQADQNSNNVAIYTDDIFTDGNKHRVVCQRTSSTDTDIEIWVDGVEQSTSVALSGWNADPQDFVSDVWFHTWNDDFNSENYFDGVIDNIILCTSALTATEIQNDYNAQPWS